MLRWMLLTLCLLLNGCQAKAKEGQSEGQKPVASASTPPKQKRGNKGVLDVTFLVASDTHFGFGVDRNAPEERDPVKDPQGLEISHKEVIRQMNAFEREREFPKALGGGPIGKPRGLLIAGDLTEKGREPEWKAFRAYYGKNGNDGLLRMPVYEAVGNHDFWEIRQKVKKDRGALAYSWDWDDLHVICLGEAPDDEILAWLDADLRGLEPDVPLILYQHFPFTGPYSNTWFTREGFDEKLAMVLKNRRVLGIFHGHFHASGSYKWHGYDVYNVGSAAKHGNHGFAVVRVTNESIKVAEWNWEARVWWWWHEKPMREKGAKESFAVSPLPDSGDTPFVWR
jgi:hypothetical protein